MPGALSSPSATSVGELRAFRCRGRIYNYRYRTRFLTNERSGVKPLLLNIFPQIDTPGCAISAGHLPFAQKRGPRSARRYRLRVTSPTRAVNQSRLRR